MLDHPVFDVALGLALLYSVLSLAASVVKERVSTLFSLRARNLEKGIGTLIGDDYAKRLYGHPLVNTLAKGGKKPSYIGADTFASALVDLLAQDEDGKPAVAMRDEAAKLARRPGPLAGRRDAVCDRPGGGRHGSRHREPGLRAGRRRDSPVLSARVGGRGGAAVGPVGLDQPSARVALHGRRGIARRSVLVRSPRSRGEVARHGEEAAGPSVSEVAEVLAHLRSEPPDSPILSTPGTLSIPNTPHASETVLDSVCVCRPTPRPPATLPLASHP